MTKLEVMADYFQMYVCDPGYKEDWSALWNDQSIDDRIVALAHTVVFGTGRNMPVPVDVVLHKQQPDLTALIAPADHAVTASLTCCSGQLKWQDVLIICQMHLRSPSHQDAMASLFCPSISPRSIQWAGSMAATDMSCTFGRQRHHLRLRCSNGGKHSLCDVPWATTGQWFSLKF